MLYTFLFDKMPRTSSIFSCKLQKSSITSTNSVTFTFPLFPLFTYPALYLDIQYIYNYQLKSLSIVYVQFLDISKQNYQKYLNSWHFQLTEYIHHLHKEAIYLTYDNFIQKLKMEWSCKSIWQLTKYMCARTYFSSFCRYYFQSYWLFYLPFQTMSPSFFCALFCGFHNRNLTFIISLRSRTRQTSFKKIKSSWISFFFR